MGLTTDRTDPCLKVIEDDGQQACYLVLSEEELSKGFIRPVRRSYFHTKCWSVTKMSQSIAETYSRDLNFYGATYCSTCKKHFQVGEYGEFIWDDRPEPVFLNMDEYHEWILTGEKVGT
jgi:hypothetical protein